MHDGIAAPTSRAAVDLAGEWGKRAAFATSLDGDAVTLNYPGSARFRFVRRQLPAARPIECV